MQYEWIKARSLVYTQFFGPIMHFGPIQLPFLVLLYDPFVYATIAVLLYPDATGKSVLLSHLSKKLPGRKRSDTAGRQTVIAGLLVVSSLILPISVFAVIRVAGLAEKPAYGKYPYPGLKVYDPYCVLARAGKPGPFIH